jgi:hypothetical protein
MSNSRLRCGTQPAPAPQARLPADTAGLGVLGRCSRASCQPNSPPPSSQVTQVGLPGARDPVADQSLPRPTLGSASQFAGLCRSFRTPTDERQKEVVPRVPSPADARPPSPRTEQCGRGGGRRCSPGPVRAGCQRNHPLVRCGAPGSGGPEAMATSVKLPARSMSIIPALNSCPATRSAARGGRARSRRRRNTSEIVC